MHRLIPVFVVFLFFSCSNKYRPFQSLYTFKSGDGKPDYRQLDYWAAHPWKQDPSDSVPAGLISSPKDSIADVFFLHPTTFTKKRDRENLNALIDDDYINAKTDYSTILYQASVFNAQCRIFAPRYRQAHIYNFFKKDKEEAAKAFDLAYEDIRKAFLFYLENWNNKRPIIIASHSQGSLLAERLLKEFFENKPLSGQLVVAYIIGWPVPKEYFSTLKICEDSLQTGCICSWRTLRNNFIPPYLKKENGNSYVTNPLNWTTGSTYASRQMNRGSVLTNFNKVYRHTTDARISNGFLYVRKPKFPWSFLFFTRNYHIADINLYYINLRDNIKARIAAFRPS
ncbi:MAG TPA: DUF3089 domain-containing protein [Chitinophagaceae bacterium]|nr:DUF3089 domain-containing protein [Chitinophagaceae bacterium]